MTTSRPALARLGITPGTRATRRSPGKLSRGTPTIIGPPCTALDAMFQRKYGERKKAFYAAWGESPAMSLRTNLWLHCRLTDRRVARQEVSSGSGCFRL